MSFGNLQSGINLEAVGKHHFKVVFSELFSLTFLNTIILLATGLRQRSSVASFM